MVGGLGEEVHLTFLGGERFDHPGAVDVLVDDGRELGHSGLAQPREREHGVSELLTENEDPRQCRKRHERQGHVDGQHEPECEYEADQAHADYGPEREQDLNGADVAVGSRYDLSRLGAVVVGEAQGREMVVQEGPQVGLHAPGHLEHRISVHEAEQEPPEPGKHHDDHQGRQTAPVLLEHRVDRSTRDRGNTHLQDEGDDARRQPDDQGSTVGPHEGHQPPHPSEVAVGVDAGPWGLVGRVDCDGFEIRCR